ncbi:MAG: DNA internalization-related competence protein ComEC/Rec2 [Steroidobacteraceae bacterium]
MTGFQALALLGGVLLALLAHAHALAGMLWLAVLGLPLWCRVRLRALAVACAGVLWAWWPLHQYDAALLPPDFDQRLLVTAQIEGLPFLRGAEESFTARLRPVRDHELGSDWLRATLHWPNAPEVRAGERWQLLVTLRAPPGNANPGSAALTLQPLRLRVHASGQVLESALNHRLSRPGATLDVLREHIARAIAARVTDRDEAALIIALAIGDTQRVSNEQWRVFNAVGITHLVAISGLHVTLFCLVMAWVAAKLWERIRVLQPRVPRHTFATLIGLAASLAYALLAGWSVPTQRTLLMLAAWHSLRWMARPRPPARTLAVGLIGVLLLDPLAPLAAGFWLSFLAVAALLVQGALTSVALSGARALLHTQMYVMAALLPATVAVFGSISLAGLAVNLVAIPLFSLLLVPLILAATVMLALCPALATLLFKLAALVIAGFWPTMHAAASTPISLLRIAPPAWWYLLAAFALAVALLPWRPWMRGTALLALLPAALPAAARIAPGSIVATVFDVGRGEAVLVHTASHALLFDDGETWGSAGAISANPIVSALRYYHVRSLDQIVLPRLDGDRGAGVLALHAVLPVRSLASGDTGAVPPEFGACQSGARWRWDGVDFEIFEGQACTLRVSTGGSSLLLPGSAAALGEALEAGDMPQGIVLAPAHGAIVPRMRQLQSNGSSPWLLLSASARDAAKADLAAALRADPGAGARTRITGLDGALEIRIGPKGVMELRSWKRP